MNIKVSIIVPIYNVEKYLPKCLESLINQSLKEIEIICVNDGSTDSSLDILKEYGEKDSRIKVYTQYNQGQSSARNLAINNATGEYLGFVDSDDWVDKDYFEKLYNAAKTNNCDIACAGFKRCGKTKKSIRKSFKSSNIYTNINDKVKIDNLPKDNYIWNKIYKRDKWDFKFTEGRYFEDLALVIKILYRMESLITVPNVYYYYRRTPNSTVTIVDKKHKDDFKWAMEELKTFVENHDIILPETKSCLRREVIKMFGVTIFKIYYYENTIKCNLLGFIPFISKSF